MRLLMQEDKQMVINDTPMKTRNPTAKWALKGTKCLHRQVTRNNTPCIMPVLVITLDCNAATKTMLRQSTRTQQWSHVPPTGAHHRLVMQQAINILTLQEQASFSMVHTPCALMKYAKCQLTSNIMQAQWYIQPPEKPSPVTKNWCMIWQQQKYGKWHLARTMKEWPRKTTKLVRKAQK